MARALGVSLVGPGTVASGAKTGTAAGSTASASSSLVPWVSGVVVAACMAAGAYVATRPAAKPAVSSAVATPVSPPAAPAIDSAAPAGPAAETASHEASPPPEDELPTKPLVSARGRRGTSAGELADQIALVDAARSALAAGGAQRALSIVSKYQSEFPNGTFRPEVSAVKVEALVKLGRTVEARALAERFLVAYGPSPLADRVAHLAHLAEP